MKHLLLFLCISASAFALTTSILVPCHPDHFPLLHSLFICYREQTVPPDEIVVSLSEAPKVDREALAALEKSPWPFAVKILKHKEKYTPGRNRNEACRASTGDIVICQDADDLPHPQRVEIIRFLFESSNIDHLLHQWISSQEKFELYDIQTVKSQITSFRTYDVIDIPGIHNGNNAFRRYVFDQVHWKPTTTIQEDVLFNRSAYVFFRHCQILKLPLLMYRPELSTFDLDGTK